MSLYSELKRRNVFRVAIAYLAGAWLITEVSGTLFPAFGIPDWGVRFVVIVFALGFAPALIISWAYELTPDGLKREKDVVLDASITHLTAKRLDGITIGLIMVALAFILTDHLWLSPRFAQQSAALTEVVTDNVQTSGSEPQYPPNSIAVLPFVDMSPDKDQEYFSDGISEELLNQLAQLKGLHVAGRTSSFYFKGKNEDFEVIGEKLGVAHILEGSVRKAENRVRITAQLIKVSDGYHLWSESYDRELDDIFAIQEEIARAVTDALSITLGVGDFGVGSTRNIEAYDAFLAARSQINQVGRDNIARAIEHLEQAVALDPDFADAWSELAAVYNNAAAVFMSEKADEFNRKSESAAARAIAIAPDSVGALFAKSMLEMAKFNWIEAEEGFEKAHSLAPIDTGIISFFAWFLVTVGRSQEMTDYFQRLVKIDPLSFNSAQLAAVGYEVSGDLEASLKECERAQGLIGDHSILNSPLLVNALTRGDRAMIDAVVERARNAASDLVPINNQALNEAMYAHLDEPDAAKAKLHRFHQNPAYDNSFVRMIMAVWASYFDDHELALELFRELSKSKSSLIATIWRPIHKPMRRLPGFKDLVRDAGLVDYWRTTGNWGDLCHPVGEDDFECE